MVLKSNHFFVIFTMIFSWKSTVLSKNETTHTVFAPGITASTKTAQKYAQAGAFVDDQYSGVIFKDQKKPKAILDKIIYKIAKKRGKALNRNKIVFGVGHDIVVLKKAIDKAKASNDANVNGVLFGTCRGAAAIINYLAKNDSTWVKGIVLDSAFSDPDVMIKNRIPAVIAKMFFPGFKKNAQTPLSAIKSIKNKNIKILMLFAKGNCAKGGKVKGDTITPFDQHTKRLYDEFKKQGFDVTLVGYNATHCAGIDTEEKDGDRTAYISAIQEWYKKNNF